MASKKTNKKVHGNVFVRTVTYHYTGHIESESADEIVLSSAAWIADSGRFAQAVAGGELSEVEPYPDGVSVRIRKSAVVDVCDWNHPLPRVQK